jgi:hypothetical protein
MIPAITNERIELSINTLSQNYNTNEWLESVYGLKIDYDHMLEHFLNESGIGRSICTYCAKSLVLLDCISTCIKGEDVSIKLAYRCSKLMSTLVVAEYHFLEQGPKHPTQYDFRASCPYFQTFEAAAVEAAKEE